MELPVKEPGLDSVRQQRLPLRSVESAIKNTGVYVRVRFQLGWDAKEERAPRIRKADGTALRGYWLADGGGLVVGNCYWQELVGGVLAHLLRAPPATAPYPPAAVRESRLRPGWWCLSCLLLSRAYADKETGFLRAGRLMQMATITDDAE